jgi:hypothetical protein
MRIEFAPPIPCNRETAIAIETTWHADTPSIDTRVAVTRGGSNLGALRGVDQTGRQARKTAKVGGGGGWSPLDASSESIPASTVKKSE